MARVEGGPSTRGRAAAVLPHLDREPALHGIALSILRAGEPADLTVVTDADGQPLAVGVRTEVKYLLCRAREPGAAALLAEDAVRRGLDLSSWMGPGPEVGRFTEAWMRHTGRRARCAVRLRLYSLEGGVNCCQT